MNPDIDAIWVTALALPLLSTKYTWTPVIGSVVVGLVKPPTVRVTYVGGSRVDTYNLMVTIVLAITQEETVTPLVCY